MLKWIKRIIVLVLLLIVGGITAFYFMLDGLVKSTIEKQGTEQLNVATTLNSVNLGLIGGTVSLDTLALASPTGFTAPQMFSIGKLSVDTGGISHLRDEPIHLNSLVIDQPKLVIEQHGTKVNFRELMDNLPKSSGTTAKPDTTTSSTPSKPFKMVINTLTLSNGQVTVQSDLPGLTKPYDITIPSITINNLGNADGTNSGATVKDVATAVIAKMVEQTTKTGKLPVNLADVLSGNLGAVTDQLDKAAQQQLDKYKVPVNVGGLLDKLTGQKK